MNTMILYIVNVVTSCDHTMLLCMVVVDSELDSYRIPHDGTLVMENIAIATPMGRHPLSLCLSTILCAQLSLLAH